jgi:hypothetical protein
MSCKTIVFAQEALCKILAWGKQDFLPQLCCSKGKLLYVSTCILRIFAGYCKQSALVAKG